MKRVTAALALSEVVKPWSRYVNLNENQLQFDQLNLDFTLIRACETVVVL